jgi:hypothetical protein
MRICIHKPTGRVLEMQSDASEGTLLANAVAAGHKKKDLEEREATLAQYHEMLAAQPASAAERRAEARRKIEALERSQGRALREAVLGGDGTRLKEIDAKITALRAEADAGPDSPAEL